MTIEEKVELYELFLNACGSENLDYIEEQLKQIYEKLKERILNMEFVYTDISIGKESEK